MVSDAKLVKLLVRLFRFLFPNLVPFSYNIRSLFVRRSTTLLTVVSIGATVAVLAGVLALQQGFATLYADNGRKDIAILLRPGATSEGESFFPKDRVEIIKKTLPHFAEGPEGPLVSGEMYLAVRLPKVDGGDTNVPIRGVEPASLRIRSEHLKISEGKMFARGTDEVIVGRALTTRIGVQVGQVIQLNTTPCRVVGVFTCEGPFESEIWGDVDRLAEVLDRAGGYNRVIGQLKPDADLKDLVALMKSNKQVQAKVQTEQDYLTGQTQALSFTLRTLGFFLAIVMGAAAVFSGTNTMLAALAARGHEIGILLSIGFRPYSIFFSFMFEALVLGLMGGAVGCLLVLPLHGVDTGTTNFQTFTEVAFAFRVTPRVLLTAVGFALVLGVMGGVLPAFYAASKQPTEVLRRK